MIRRAAFACALLVACSDDAPALTDAASEAVVLVPPTDTTFGGNYFNVDPRHVRLNWSDDPSRTITALWSTAPDAPLGELQVGASPHNLTLTAPASARTIGTALTGRVTVHEARISGLAPDTTYHYRVGAEGHRSELFHFKTAPSAEGRGDVNFVVSGDSAGDLAAWRTLQARALSSVPSGTPDFAIFTGDAVTDTTVQSQWNAWFDAARLGLANMPWVMVHGHREALSSTYFGLIAQPTSPGDGLYFSFNYGPLHVLVLNDTVAGGESALRAGPELDFIATDLAAVDRDRTPWVIVTQHRSPYASGRGARDAASEAVRAAWTPIYDRHDVDLVLCGHAHDFEVTRSLRDQRTVAENRGAVYFVASGGGSGLSDVSSTALTRHVERTQSYLVVHATRTALEVTPHRLDGTVISAGQVRLSRL